jgi:N-acetylglucosaminyl-diphospho-decaprenol L-rhamnosyltransferase
MLVAELSIVIVNWNSADYVMACIRSIREQTSSVRYEIIVVDNASFDGCGERLAQEHPGVIFLQSPYNLGFAEANNLGAKHAKGFVLLFLNPDTELQDRAIERLYTKFKRLDDAGIVGCRLINSDGSLQTSCVQSQPTLFNQILDADILRRWFPKAAIWGNKALLRGEAMPVEVEAVSGACMMIRREVFERVNGFSPDYFMYSEDLDICYKTRHIGFRNYHLGAAVIIHHGGGSSQRATSKFSAVMAHESMNRFFRKFRGSFYSHCYRFILSGSAMIRLGIICLLYPGCMVLGRIGRWNVTFRKWLVIFRWGIGLERWAGQYGQEKQLAVRSCDATEKSCRGSVEESI